jgi:hypothetical protein
MTSRTYMVGCGQMLWHVITMKGGEVGSFGVHLCAYAMTLGFQLSVRFGYRISHTGEEMPLRVSMP